MKLRSEKRDCQPDVVYGNFGPSSPAEVAFRLRALAARIAASNDRVEYKVELWFKAKETPE